MNVLTTISLAVLLAGVAFLDGCQFLASEPEPGDLKATWLVFDEPEIKVGERVPLVVTMVLANERGGSVRVPVDRFPSGAWAFEGEPGQTVQALPKVLKESEEAVAVWVLPGGLPAGRYEIGRMAGPDLEAAPARIAVEPGTLAEPERLRYEGLYAKSSGQLDGFVAEVLEACDAGTAPPSSRFILAEMLESAGRRAEAREQYERFLEETFDDGPVPAWLRSRLDDLESPLKSDE